MKLFYKMIQLCQQSFPHFAKHMGKAVLLLLLSCFIGGSAYAQNRTITGVVTDKSAGLPIPGVSIKLKDAQTVVATDGDGKYSISVPAGPATLVYLYLGFVTREITVTGTTQNIALDEAKTDLNEVVVLGYSTQKRSDITSAVVTLDSKEILKSPTGWSAR